MILLFELNFFIFFCFVVAHSTVFHYYILLGCFVCFFVHFLFVCWELPLRFSVSVDKHFCLLFSSSCCCAQYKKKKKLLHIAFCLWWSGLRFSYTILVILLILLLFCYYFLAIWISFVSKHTYFTHSVGWNQDQHKESA